jgi:hypothetical protein
MINHDALNALYNGERTSLGQLPGFREAFTQVGFRQDFKIAGFDLVQIERRGDGALLWRDRVRGQFYYDRAAGRLGENKTIVRRMQNELAQAIILGEGIPQISNRIRSICNMTFNQARRIARTETIRALNQGKHLAALQAAEGYDIPMQKQWLATLDERTRSTPPDNFDHAEMHGVTVALEDAFDVSGESLQYPNDPNGSAGNIINCRCTAIYVLDVQALKQQRLERERENGIIDAYDDVPEIAAERKKILDGTYSTRVTNAQRKHVEGTHEFEQKRNAMPRGSEPSKLKPGVNAQMLVDRHKGTGVIQKHQGSPIYPREIIVTDSIIGETWVKSLNKYVDTRAFVIMYSGNGVHVVPVNERGRV